MNRVLHALLLALVVLAPLPLGSNREWSWTLCTLLAAGLAVGWGGAALMRPATVIRGLPAWIPVLFLAVCAWALVQTASWVPAEWRYPVWRLAADSLGEPLAGRISLAEDDTVTALLELATHQAGRGPRERQESMLMVEASISSRRVRLAGEHPRDRKSTRLNSSHSSVSRMPSSA